jgi:hypothetical protein
MGGFLVEALATRIRARARQGDAHLQAWIALAERLENSFGHAVGLNLEPRQTLLSAARDLAQTARRAGRI